MPIDAIFRGDSSARHPWSVDALALDADGAEGRDERVLEVAHELLYVLAVAREVEIG